MKNVFKVIYALIAIALVYVLYLIALGNRYEICQTSEYTAKMYDKWKKQVIWVYQNKAPFEWRDWDEFPEK